MTVLKPTPILTSIHKTLRVLVSASTDGSVRWWDQEQGVHLATLRAERPYERLDISHTSGLTNAQQTALRALGAVGAEGTTPL